MNAVGAQKGSKLKHALLILCCRRLKSAGMHTVCGAELQQLAMGQLSCKEQRRCHAKSGERRHPCTSRRCLRAPFGPQRSSPAALPSVSSRIPTQLHMPLICVCG